MSIAKSVVNKPVTVFIIYAILIIMGIVTALQLPLDLFPDINPPFLVIYTSYNNAGPEQVEKTVTRPLEASLSNVSNMKGLTSTSRKGSSMIMLEMGWGEDLGEAANEVRDKLEFIKDFLPEDASSPQIFKFDPSMMPVMELSIKGNRPADELFRYAEDTIIPSIEQVPGVSMAEAYGGRKAIIRVEIPQNRLEAYNLTLTQVSQMLAIQNMQMGSGNVSQGSFEYLVQTTGEFSSIEDLKNTVIAYKASSPQTGARSIGAIPSTRTVLLRDIANVYRSHEDASSLIFVNGEPGLDISIQKQSGTNSVKTANAIYKKLDQLKETLPPDVEMEVIYDTTNMIRASLKQVSSSAILGIILAMIVLFVFLRNIKSTLIIGVSIPVSIIITLMFMNFMGLTLNMMTMAGLTLGIGMIVDSSIVVLENIYRYREKGAKLKSSAILGTQEMITAITASILTTVCVFIPVIVFKGELDMVGIIFEDLAFTIIITLLASLVVAMTFVPVLSSSFLKIYTRKQNPIKNPKLLKIDGYLEQFFKKLDRGYKKLLSIVLRHKASTVIALVLLLVLSFVMIPTLIPGVDFLPASEEEMVTIDLNMPTGTKMQVTEDVVQRLTDVLKKELTIGEGEEAILGYQSMLLQVGTGSMLGAPSGYKGRITVLLPEHKDRVFNSFEVKEKIRAHFDEFPGVDISFGSSMNMMGSSDPIDITLKSENMDLAIKKGEEIVDILKTLDTYITEPYVDVDDSLPQVEVRIDREKAYSLGLNVMTVGSEISANIDGKVATIFRENGEEFDVRVILQESDRNAIPDLQDIFVTNSMGQRIAVSNFASLKKGTSPVAIKREDRSRAIHIKAGLKPKVSAMTAEKMVKEAIQANYVPDDKVFLSYSGDMKDMITMMFKFIGILFLAIILVFGVMASQFESLLDPFIIFLSVPFLFIGIIVIYTITQTTFSVYTAVGLVMLVGIAVNNGIVMVDYTNLLRNRGMKIESACIEAGGNRLRPVLMTSLTTILGMAPLAFAYGEGSDMLRPLGQCIVGGMASSTLFTLLIIPIIYSIFNRKQVPRKITISRLESADNINPEAKALLMKYYNGQGKTQDNLLCRCKGVQDEQRTDIFNALVEIGYGSYRKYRHN